jgi:carnitine O-acetyltransferase
MGEHSVMDGTPSVTMLDRMLAAINDQGFDTGNRDQDVFEAPRLLNWLVTPAITAAIQNAERSAESLITKQALGMLTVTYGRDEIKRLGFSPDGWTQMIIQLAYHRLSARLNGAGRRRDGGTYEAASTRGFLKGRTETIRIVTEEAMAWCDSMDNSDVSVEERRRLFKIAVSKHREDADAAVKASGIDRHLFGELSELLIGFL